MKSFEKKIFAWAHLKGECTTGDTHIIDIRETFDDQNEGRYRIYHKNGYCVEVSKLVETQDDHGNPLTYCYDIFQEWEGFDKISYAKFYDLITQNNKIIS